MSSSYRVACIQMVSTPVVAENLRAAGELVARAAGEGAQLVALPEYFCILGMKDTDKVAAREKAGAGPVQDWLAETAARHKTWIVGGTLPIDCGSNEKILNTCLVHDAAGVARPAFFNRPIGFGKSSVSVAVAAEDHGAGVVGAARTGVAHRRAADEL